ncbi:M23 family metallopeptidase (plasmid) [Coraliomargarita sp. W4R53]
MSAEAPQAENAPTRRSSRIASTPVQPSGDGVSRAQRRQQTGAIEQPAISLGFVSDEKQKDAVAVASSDGVVGSETLGRRARRSASGVVPNLADAPQSAGVAEEALLTSSDADEFASAARLFAFTSELPQQDEDLAGSEVRVTENLASEHVATAGVTTRANHVPKPSSRRVSRGTAFRRAATMSFSVGAMALASLLAVSVTTPAAAVAAMGTDVAVLTVAGGDVTATGIDEDEIQAYVAPATIENATLDRDGGFDTVTAAELASESGISNVSDLFVNDPNAAIQWPFAVGVPMSYGFGMRSGTLHEGVDFTPGEGAPIQAIADGVVRVATEAGSAYGVHVIIDHEIDGVLVSSHYAHMQYGSLQVTPGQTVTVGTVLGHTGNTGRSFGAHTHFEILMNGTTAIDPLPWLREHTGG